ncbi:hypothetical protein DZC72_00495 [Maribacter algicola]|uniref:Uncharacterized protein n=1 Tax=Maribacter algicola TaxID=2498892 RepID=A0A3R8RN93_9FLAO|nr:hypothetical protein DZC72_00495 [Maribacter algicola]
MIPMRFNKPSQKREVSSQVNHYSFGKKNEIKENRRNFDEMPLQLLETSHFIATKIKEYS